MRYQFADCVLDTERYELYRAGQPVKLRRKAFDLLIHLTTQPGQVLNKHDLVEKVWPDRVISDATLNSSIKEVRQAIGDDGKDQQLIQTHYGRGYQFLGNVKSSARTEFNNKTLEVNQHTDNPLGSEHTPRKARPPVVAVLPMKNLSGLSQWEYFVDGITEDIITDLTRFADIGVIAHHSSFTYKNKPIDIRQVGAELNSDYVLEGSIQVHNSKVRVSIQLINTKDATHLWAERYDRDCEDLFEIQDDIVQQVSTSVGGFDGAILRTERNNMRRRPPASLKAYELYLLGYELEEQFTEESNKESMKVLEQALEIDPNYARLWTVLGWASYFAVEYNWTRDPVTMKAQEQACVRMAAELDPRDPVALKDLGILQAQEGDIENATKTFKKALELGRNFSDVLIGLAQFFVIVMGDQQKAKQLIEDGFRLNPYAPKWCYMNLVRVSYFTRDFEAAISAAKKSANDFPQTKLFTTLSLAQLGRTKETYLSRKAFNQQFPNFNFERQIKELPLTNRPSLNLYADGLEKAGFV